MLVLSRKRGDQIVVPGYGVTVTVLAVEGNAVRLGITAPPEVVIHRAEVQRRLVALAARPPAKG